MGRFTSEIVNGQVILRRKVAEAAAPPSQPTPPAEDKGVEVVTEETPDPKTRRRPKADEVVDG
jgi:hypothetical protein